MSRQHFGTPRADSLEELHGSIHASLIAGLCGLHRFRSQDSEFRSQNTGFRIKDAAFFETIQERPSIFSLMRIAFYSDVATGKDVSPLQGSSLSCINPRAYARTYSLPPLRGWHFHSCHYIMQNSIDAFPRTYIHPWGIEPGFLSPFWIFATRDSVFCLLSAECCCILCLAS